MADPTPPTPTPDPTPNPHPRGEINQAWLDELTNAEAISTAAQKPDYAATLALGGIDAAKTAALDGAIASARQLVAKAVQSTHGKTNSTDDEQDLADDLIGKIQEVQKRARQKYDATDPGKLADYAIGGGTKFYSSRSLLEQTAANILAKLAPQPPPGGGPAPAPDVLPGISPAKITALQQAASDYQDSKGDQTGEQSDATGARKLLEAAIADIVAKRREIQFAADADWPHDNPANAGIRAEFQLPPDRVMK
jgi:hypothetical protein